MCAVRMRVHVNIEPDTFKTHLLSQFLHTNKYKFRGTAIEMPIQYTSVTVFPLLHGLIESPIANAIHTVTK